MNASSAGITEAGETQDRTIPFRIRFYSFGKGSGFGILLFFFNFIGMAILDFGDAEYLGPQERNVMNTPRLRRGVFRQSEKIHRQSFHEEVQGAASQQHQLLLRGSALCKYA